MIVQVKLRQMQPGAVRPKYMTPGAAGADLFSCHPQPVQLYPGEHKLILTGWAFEIPVGYEGQIRPRSGLALRHGVTVLNAPGTIDSDYRGEVGVVLINLGNMKWVCSPGERIAQIVFGLAYRAGFGDVEELAPTERDVGGFGSTGV